MEFSSYAKVRILYYHEKGLRSTSIARALKSEGISASVVGIWKLLKRYDEDSTTARRAGSGRAKKVTAEVADLVESQMQQDDETTATQLRKILVSKGHNISLSTIRRSRKTLGWTFRGSAYCQLIRDANKTKRLEWARANLACARNA